MGGVAGHMDHLYDNRDLTFGKIKEILEAASNGELSAEEKVDGQNLFLSYSIPEGKAKGARNKGNLKAGGLDATELAHKFAGRQGLEEAFNGGFSTFEKAVGALSDEEKERIFGPDTNIWYNAEIMDPGSMNVIKYDDKTLKIHDVGHFVFDRENEERSPIPEGSLEALDASLDRMRNVLHGSDFKIARKALIQLQKLEDDEALGTAIAKINNQMSLEGLSDDSTILDYLISRLIKGIDTDLSLNFKKEIVNYLLKLPSNVGLKALKKGLSPENLNELNSIVSSKRTLLQQAIEPLELIIHDFTVEVLKSLKSVFIADNDKEVLRLKTELSKAVNDITSVGAENPEAMAVMQRHLNKIKDFSHITTPVEAVVFDYDGHTYKFAGNFSPLNQILGIFRYGNLKRKTNESINSDMKVITEKDGKRIALFPGKFKPPHRGHFDYANKIARRPDVDELIILISPVDYPEVSNSQALKIWNEYLKNGEPNITAKIADYRSPVQAVYEFVADPENAGDGDTVLLIKSSKDVGDTRFDRAQSYAERKNPGVNVEDIVEDPVQSRTGVIYSARDMRKAIQQGDRESFISYLPTDVDGNMVWSLVTNTTEGINKIIDDTIDEMSTMAGGSVEGSAGGFGPPNNYNSFKRPKVRRPKVRRAKRQRRR